MTLYHLTPAASGGVIAISNTDPDLAAWGETAEIALDHLRGCIFAIELGHPEDACRGCLNG